MEKQLKPGRFIKSCMVKAYADRLKEATCLFVTDFSGLTNKELEELRRKLRPVSARYIIVKDSICRLALEKMKIAGVTDMITASCALGYGKGDPVSISKVLVNFSKSNKNLKVRGGYLDGAAITEEVVRELAALPSREVLLTRLVSCLNSPVAGFVSVCSGIIRKFLYALNEVSGKKQT